jgi:hypothetical protein
MSVQCPQCSKKIQIPSAAPASSPQTEPIQQSKPCPFCGEQIILPKSGATGSSPAYTPPQKKTSKVGIVVALVIGLVIGYGVGSAKGPSGISKLSGGISLPSFGRMTKEQWWAKLEKNELKFPGYRAVVRVPKDKFLQIMGKPDKTQAVGENVMWYYTCSDGQIQMVLSDLALTMFGKIATESINEY